MLRLRFDPLQMLTWLEIRKHLAGTRSMLDAGCGSKSLCQLLDPDHLVGIDGYGPSVELARKNGTHHEVMEGDIRELNGFFDGRRFDACIAVDVIEHLPKKEGLQFAKDLERIASKRVVLLTPSGFLPQGHAEQDDLQAHHSGWEPEEMRGMGYKVIGLLGPKAWRGEYHALRYRPRIFWAILALLAHLFWTKRHPASAAAILCVKDVSSGG